LHFTEPFCGLNQHRRHIRAAFWDANKVKPVTADGCVNYSFITFIYILHQVSIYASLMSFGLLIYVCRH